MKARAIGRLAWLGALGLLLAAVCGCDPGRVVVVSRWTLDALDHGPGTTLELPTKLPGADRAGAFVLRAEVPLPDDLRGRTLTLAIPQVEGRTTLVVAGEPIVPLDDPGAGWRGDRAPRFRIEPDKTSGATLPLVLTIENGAPQSAFLPSAPRLSPTHWGDARFRATRALNKVSAAVALGALLGMFVTYSVLWALDRSRRAHGLLAIGALCSITSPLLWLEWAQLLFGRLEMIVVSGALAVAGIAVVWSAREHFGLPPPSRAWWWLFSVLAALTGLATVSPLAARVAPALGLVADYLVLGSLGIVLARLARRRPRPPDVAIMAAALGTLVVSTLPAAAWRFGLRHPLEGIVLTPLGMTVFLLLHSVTLSRAHVATLRTTDALNAELAARVEQLVEKNREVEVLNVELRRQIADRSAKLAEALSRLEGVSSRGGGFREGEIVDERYRVLRRLGAGGMGAVHEVERTSDGRRFALKVLHGDTSGPALARFAREAEIAARLHHPNLISVVDVDVARSGSLYIVMELVEGASLEERRDRFGDAAWAVPILAQVAEGIAALHANGVIHRDLKPGNVLVDDLGHARISDFGISALRETIDPLAETRTPDAVTLRSDPQLTRTGAMLGTPLYMAPELWRGADRADEASDVWSFGLVAYLLLANRFPFDAPPIHEAGAGRALRAPEPLAGVDPELARVVTACLSLVPSDRPTARAIADAFRAPPTC